MPLRTLTGARSAHTFRAERSAGRGRPRARRVWRFGRERFVYDNRSPRVLIYREPGRWIPRERPLPVDLIQVELRHGTLEISAPGLLWAASIRNRELPRAHELMALVNSHR